MGLEAARVLGQGSGMASRWCRLGLSAAALAAAVVTDAPTRCPAPLGRRGFCLVAASSPSTSPALVALSVSSGMVEATVLGIQRLMSTTPGLYQTSGRPSVLVGVRTPGGTDW